MNRTRLMFVASLLALMGLVVPTAQADTLSQNKQHLSQLQKEAAQTSKSLTASKKQAQDLQAAIQTNKNSIQTVSAQIEANRLQLRKLSDELNQLTKKVSQNEVKLQTDENHLKTILRTQYENGSVPYLDVIFHATSWSDFVSRVEMLSRVAAAENQLLNETKVVQKQLQTEQAAQSASYQQVQQKSNQLQSLQAEYTKLEHQQEVSLAKTNTQVSVEAKHRNMLESQIQLTQSQIRAIQEATLQAEAKMNNQGYVAEARQGLQAVDASSLIQYADQFIGLPYIWGGTTPSPGFDCSGFTQYVFNHFGVSIGRDTWTQFSGGVPVDRNNLQPGDLVFFSTYAQGASHVGIYIGDGKMIDSEDAGLIITPIFSSSYWAPRYIGARDYIKH